LTPRQNNDPRLLSLRFTMAAKDAGDSGLASSSSRDKATRSLRAWISSAMHFSGSTRVSAQTNARGFAGAVSDIRAESALRRRNRETPPLDVRRLTGGVPSEVDTGVTGVWCSGLSSELRLSSWRSRGTLMVWCHEV